MIDETLEAGTDVLPLYVWQMNPLRLVQMSCCHLPCTTVSVDILTHCTNIQKGTNIMLLDNIIQFYIFAGIFSFSNFSYVITSNHRETDVNILALVNSF